MSSSSTRANINANVTEGNRGRRDAEILLVANADVDRVRGLSLRDTVTTLVFDAGRELGLAWAHGLIVSDRRSAMLAQVMRYATYSERQLVDLVRRLRDEERMMMMM
jgi:hypothetical protein